MYRVANSPGLTRILRVSTFDLRSSGFRVPKPGGKFFFMEHVKAPPQFYVVRFIQVLINPVWLLIRGGCHLTRSTHENIRKAGFRCVNMEEFEAHELTDARLVRSHISGTATK